MKSILVVDDNPENRYMLEVTLKSRSFHVRTASNGKDAMEMIESEQPDLIISDILMPVMDGFIFLGELKKEPRLSRIPFIFYTATYIDQKDELFALSLGADKFIRKPVTSSIFIEEIIQVINSSPERKAPDRELLNPKDHITYKLYSERLIQKLEKKMMDLENEIQIRKKAEDSLRESEERFRQVIENIREVFWIKNLSTEKIDYVSPHFTVLLGIHPETLEKNPGALFGNIVKEDQGLVNEALIRQTNELRPADVTYRIHGENGKIKWIRSRTFPIDDGTQKQVRIAGITEDITLRKETEIEKEALRREIERSRKLEALGTLSGGIAHDFNNILSSILGFSELSLEDLDKESPVFGYVSEIFTSAKRARDVVRQILTFTRQKEPELKPVNLVHIVQEALQLLRPSIPSSIKLSHLPFQDMRYVMADASKIHQVMVNLCTNSIHAMKEKGGNLTISYSFTEIEKDNPLIKSHRELKNGEYIKITVEDTGEGIAPDHLDKIFDPFFTTKDSDQGVGLGLSVVHGIITNHHGAIAIDSILGKGSRVFIYLPVSTGRELFEDKEIHVLPKGNETILWVDDEESIVKIGAQKLGRLGYRVETSTDPLEAVDKFRKDPLKYHLIITDMAMPKMTGDKLAQEMMRVRRNIPVILCTGFSREVTPQKAKKMGIASMLMKPIEFDILLKNMRKILDGSGN